jgi:hypothetical protein
MSAAAMRTEHVQQTPRGWRVRTIVPGPQSKHEVRIAFPPGRRRKASGRVVEILHPAEERNPKCDISKKARTNPGELLIFGNPDRKGFGNHKPGCPCKFCDRARRLQSGELKPPPLPNRRKKNSQAAKRATRERAARIRGARLNPWHVGQRVIYSTASGDHTGTITKVMTKTVLFKFDKDGHTISVWKTAIKANPKRSGPRRRRADRNPSETKQAVRLFQGFHGHDPKEISAQHVSAAVRLDYTALGDMKYLIVETPLGKEATFTFEGDGVKLASSPDGKQLYCIGGNQNILPLLEEHSAEKDFIDLGDCLEVAYLARKVHGEFRPIEYFHEFGELNGALPRLMFDKVRKQLFFIGGDYFINVNVRAPGTPLGKVSPGIEN